METTAEKCAKQINTTYDHLQINIPINPSHVCFKNRNYAACQYHRFYISCPENKKNHLSEEAYLVPAVLRS